MVAAIAAPGIRWYCRGANARWPRAWRTALSPAPGLGWQRNFGLALAYARDARRRTDRFPPHRAPIRTHGPEARGPGSGRYGLRRRTDRAGCSESSGSVA